MKHVARFLEEHITTDSLAKGKFDCLEAVAVMSYVELLPSKREITIEFGPNEVQCEIASIHSEVALRFAGAYKWLAIAQGKLQPMWHEAALPHPAVKVEAYTGVEVDQDVVVHCCEARRCAGEDFTASGCGSSDVVRSTMKKKAAKWIEDDKDFGIDIASLNTLTGPASEKRVVDLACTYLASETAEVTVQQAYASLQGMEASSIYRLSSHPAQAKFGLIKSVLARTLDGRYVDLTTLADDEYLKLALDRMPYFVRNGEAPAIEFGGKALTSFYELAKPKHDRGQLAKSDWGCFDVWSDLLPAESRKEIADFVKDCKKKDAGAVKRGPTKARSEAKKKAKSSGGQSSADVAVAEAMAMFA